MATMLPCTHMPPQQSPRGHDPRASFPWGTLVELTSGIQALDLQSLLCEAGVYMVRLNRGPQSLTPTSTAPQAACQCGQAKGEGFHSHQGSALSSSPSSRSPGCLGTVPGLEPGCRAALSTQPSSAQRAVGWCRVGCMRALLRDGAFLLDVRCELCLQLATALSLTYSLRLFLEEKYRHLAPGF